MAHARVVGNDDLRALCNGGKVAERRGRKNRRVRAGRTGKLLLALAREHDGLDAELAQGLDQIVEVRPVLFLSVVLAAI